MIMIVEYFYISITKSLVKYIFFFYLFSTLLGLSIDVCYKNRQSKILKHFSKIWSFDISLGNKKLILVSMEYTIAKIKNSYKCNRSQSINCFQRIFYIYTFINIYARESHYP